MMPRIRSLLLQVAIATVSGLALQALRRYLASVEVTPLPDDRRLASGDKPAAELSARHNGSVGHDGARPTSH